MDQPLPIRFAAAMARLDPWEAVPLLAAGVSGGADSTALAILGNDWARAQGGRLLALIVDHGLRAESAAEARLTHDRLAALGIESRILTVDGLTRGPALAERARIARYDLLRAACEQAGIPHLLLGHHALDQAETVMMRALGGSGSRGLAGMPAITEGAGPRLLRPLLAEPPAVLRAFLVDRGVAWVEDPSNASPAARRSRLRLRQGGPEGDGPGTIALVAAASDAGHRRTAQDRRIADILAERVTIRPEGFVRLTPGVIDPDALSAVIRTIGGAAYPPSPGPVAALARSLRPMTLAGVRVMEAGRLGPGWLLIREERSIAPAIPADRGAIWDGRFRVLDDAPGCSIGALAADAAPLRRLSTLPSAVLRTLPALRYGNVLAAVPHLLYREPAFGLEPRVVFHPPVPLAGAPFAPI